MVPPHVAFVIQSSSLIFLYITPNSLCEGSMVCPWSLISLSTHWLYFVVCFLATQKFGVVQSNRLISLKIFSAENIPDIPLPKRGLVIKPIQNVTGYHLVKLFLCGNLRQWTLEVKLELFSENLRDLSWAQSSSLNVPRAPRRIPSLYVHETYAAPSGWTALEVGQNTWTPGSCGTCLLPIGLWKWWVLTGQTRPENGIHQDR
jgi:hypothetical protein